MLSTHPIPLANKTLPNITSMIEKVKLALTELLDKKTKIATDAFFEHLNKIAEKTNEIPAFANHEILPVSKHCYDIPQLVIDFISPIIELHYNEEATTFDIANKLSLLYVNLVYLHHNGDIARHANLHRRLLHLDQLVNGNPNESSPLTIRKILTEKTVDLSRLIHISSILINHLAKHTSEEKEFTEIRHKPSITIFSLRKKITNQLKSCSENLERINAFLVFANNLLWQTDRVINPHDTNELFMKSYEPYIQIQTELLAHRRFLLKLKNSKNKTQVLHPIKAKYFQDKMQAYQKKLSLYYGRADLATILYKQEKERRENTVKVTTKKEAPRRAETKEARSFERRFPEFSSVKQTVDSLYSYLSSSINLLQTDTEQQDATFKQFKLHIDAIYNATRTQFIEEQTAEITLLLCRYSKDDIIAISNNQITPAKAHTFSNGISAFIQLKKLLVLSRVHQDTLRYIPHCPHNRLRFLSTWAETEIEALQKRVRTNTTRPPFAPSLLPINESVSLSEEKITNENMAEEHAPSLYERHKAKAAAFLIGAGIGLFTCFIPVIGPIFGALIALSVGALAAIKHKAICGFLEKIKNIFCCDRDNLRHQTENASSAQLTALEETSTLHIMRHTSLPHTGGKKKIIGEPKHFASPFLRRASGEVKKEKHENNSVARLGVRT